MTELPMRESYIFCFVKNCTLSSRMFSSMPRAAPSGKK